MTDLALHWDDIALAGDLRLVDGALETDDGLRTAILISLFSDARAGDDDALPEPGADRRGWWGNAFPAVSGDAGNPLGSLLWLLERAKTTQGNLRRAEEAARNALQWLIDDQIASSVAVTVERQTSDAMERIAIRIELERPNGPARQRFDIVWEASA